MKRIERRSQWRIWVPSVFVVYLFCGVLPLVFEVTFGMDIRTHGGIVFFHAVGAAMLSPLPGILVCAWQICTYELIKKRTQGILSILLLTWPIIPIGFFSVYRSLPRHRANEILAGAQFSPLPQSASRIKVLTWSTPFSGEKYLRFRADTGDITWFLAHSPILTGAPVQEYSAQKMRVFYRPDAPRGVSAHDGHEYIPIRPTAPAWYMQEIRHEARRYRIRPRGYNSGEVIVQKADDFVFIRLTLG